MNKEKQIDIIRDLLTEFDEMSFVPSTAVPNHEAYAIQWRAEITKALEDYFKQTENAVELPCKVGDFVRFKGFETPWKVSAIHIYEEGQPQITITSETEKITCTMTVDEFHMFRCVIADTKMKDGE